MQLEIGLFEPQKITGNTFQTQKSNIIFGSKL